MGPGLYRHLWTSLPSPVESAQILSERTVFNRIKVQNPENTPSLVASEAAEPVDIFESSVLYLGGYPLQ
jgi:hypothetical protein